MPLPRSLKPLVRTRRFWTDFFWETDTDDDTSSFNPCTIKAPVGGGSGLALSLDSSFGYLSLGLLTPKRRPVEIAWDDQAHWHPHVLRWTELETICRAAAVQDDRLPHPGPLLLLLHRFAPICPGDDLDVIVPMLEDAWRQVDGFSNAEITAWIERNDARDAGFRWRYEETVNGWCLEQGDEEASRTLYTLRSAENDEFPFDAWSRMLAEAERTLAGARGVGGHAADNFAETGTMARAPEIARSLRTEGRSDLADALGDAPTPARVCWVVETLRGFPAGTLVKRFVPPTVALRKKHSLRLDLPLQDAERPLPTAAGKLLTDTLDRLLRHLNQGSAQISGSISSQGADGASVTREWSLSIQIKGDLAAGVALVRDALWWVGAPTSARLSQGRRVDIAHGLTDGPTKTSPIVLQMGRLRTAYWNSSGRTRHRFDREPLPAPARAAVRSVLADTRADGPDEDGWYAIRLPDGGAVLLCFPRLDAPDAPAIDAPAIDAPAIDAPGGDDTGLDPFAPDDASTGDSGTAVIDSLTPDASHLLYALLTAGGMLLLPAALAPTAEVAATVTVPWPPVRVVTSPTDLHAILQAGPFAWWQDRTHVHSRNWLSR